MQIRKWFLEGLHGPEHSLAVDLFTQAVSEYPECRHAHAGLGAALWQRHQSTHAKDDLRAAVGEFVQAAEIGMGYGKVRYTHRQLLLQSSLSHENSWPGLRSRPAGSIEVTFADLQSYSVPSRYNGGKNHYAPVS
jgi:hypothetical protein